MRHAMRSKIPVDFSFFIFIVFGLIQRILPFSKGNCCQIDMLAAKRFIFEVNRANNILCN
jgi:hypothetical protein